MEQMNVHVVEVDVALGESEKLTEDIDPLDDLKEVHREAVQKVDVDKHSQEEAIASVENQQSETEVIGLLMQQAEQPDGQASGGTADDGNAIEGSSFQSLQAITLADGTTAYVQQLVDHKGNAVEEYHPHLQAVIQNLPEMAALATQKDSENAIEGQAVQLEDGTTAYIQNTGKDGIQAVQLADGSTAFIATSNAESLFAGSESIEGTNLTLDGLENQLHSDHQSMVQASTGLTASEDEQSQAVTPQKVHLEIGQQRLGSGKTIVIGDKAYKCQFDGCDRLYTTHHHLKVHERSHTGDRPYRCTYSDCGKAFATAYGLKSHTRVHTGEKPYKCPEESCNKGFKTSGDLQKHIRIHTGERPFKCPFEGCDKSFTTSNIRKVHIRTHTGERPYTCDYEGCGRSFASATNYKNHIRIHTGEKPYVCTVEGCGKRFTEYSSLYKHHVVHTHTKPYVCAHCNKTYRQTSTLAMHKRTAHGDDTCLDLNIELTLPKEEQLEDGEPAAKQMRLDVPGTVLPQQEGTAPGTLVINPTDNKQVTLLTSDGISLDSLQQTINQQSQQQQGMPALQSILVVTDPTQLQALQAAFKQQSMLQVENTGTEQTFVSLQQGAGHAVMTTAATEQPTSCSTVPANTQADSLPSDSLVSNNL